MCVLAQLSDRVSFLCSTNDDKDNEANSSDESEAVLPPNPLRSSLSSENLQLDLAKSAASDGLSDKENIIRQIQNQMKLSSSKLGAVRTSLRDRLLSQMLSNTQTQIK